MKLFIFDMGGVVTTNASEVRGRAAQALGVSFEEMQAAVAAPLEGMAGQNAGGNCSQAQEGGLFGALTCGKITEKEFWKAVGDRLGKKIETDFFHLYFHPVMNEEVKKIILGLRKKGHRVVCGTNTIQSHYLNHLSRGDYAIFDQTYASQLMGAKKPDPLFWKLILDAENADASEAFFTDDMEENVKAASSLGIHAVQFIGARELKKAIKEFLNG
ncbi:MAG: HAD family phosphatase [Treponema sp.]|nr:HAD family phosphatase [Treponema sp.]